MSFKNGDEITLIVNNPSGGCLLAEDEMILSKDSIKNLSQEKEELLQALK